MFHSTKPWLFYDDVYLPLMRIIHEQGLIADFPERTEADPLVGTRTTDKTWLRRWILCPQHRNKSINHFKATETGF